MDTDQSRDRSKESLGRITDGGTEHAAIFLECARALLVLLRLYSGQFSFGRLNQARRVSMAYTGRGRIFWGFSRLRNNTIPKTAEGNGTIPELSIKPILEAPQSHVFRKYSCDW